MSEEQAGRSPEQEHEHQHEQEQRLPTVPEVVISTVHLLVTLGARAAGERDAEQCRLAVEGIRGLMPLLEQIVPAEHLTQYRQALAELQMAYARALEPQSETEPQPEVPVAERPKIWTPGGEV
jgi:hypothetical protein